MKKLMKSLILSGAILGLTFAPEAAYACGSFGECSGGTCVICFATSSPNGSGCAYTCRIVK